MKRCLLFSLLVTCLSLVSCSKDEEDAFIADTPRSEVPDELVGQWLNGTFSMSNWWTYDGTYAGNPYSSSRAFTLHKDGSAEFFQVIKTYNGSCATEAFSYFKGTVDFNNNTQSFTFYPQRGNFRGFYSCSGESNFDRSPTKEELKPFTLYWNAESDSNDQLWMVTRWNAGDPDSEASYFKPASW